MGYYNELAYLRGYLFKTDFYININQSVNDNGYIIDNHNIISRILRDYNFEFMNVPEFLNNLLLNFLFRYKNTLSYIQIWRFFCDEQHGFKFLFNEILDHMGAYYDDIYNSIDYRISRWNDLNNYFRSHTIRNGRNGNAINIQNYDIPDIIRSPIFSPTDRENYLEPSAINNQNDLTFN